VEGRTSNRRAGDYLGKVNVQDVDSIDARPHSDIEGEDRKSFGVWFGACLDPTVDAGDGILHGSERIGGRHPGRGIDELSIEL
jgi:hypothetical protein